MVLINEKAPKLEVDTTAGKMWTLADFRPKVFGLIVFYEGYHSLICRNYLQKLNSLLEKFKAAGVDDIIAISGDTKQRAEAAKEEWEIDELVLGYGQTVESMRDWGLYVSSSIAKNEPGLFGEPGIFLIDSNKTVYFAAYSSAPFARPDIEDIYHMVNFIQEKDYPSRGREKIQR